MIYIYKNSNWSNFTWNYSIIEQILAEVRFLQGTLLGKMSNLGFELQNETSLQILTQDIVKTSEIEGEKLQHQDVRSSVARRLGVTLEHNLIKNHKIESIVEITLDAINNYNQALTKDRLFYWHKTLFSYGINNLEKINIGSWRNHESGTMEIISGPFGRETVHYEAPHYSEIEAQMASFLKWLNADLHIDKVIKAGIAHFWFVTIHPFDDGNGRIARVISDMILAQSEKSNQRFYSMSSQIQKDRQSYYEILEKCQKSTSDITLWLEWFLLCLKRAIKSSENILNDALLKSSFWQKNSNYNFNARQKLIINKLLDNLEGNLTTSKWAKICKCSQDTALRDIIDLVNKNILQKDKAGGRSTCYLLRKSS